MLSALAVNWALPLLRASIAVILGSSCLFRQRSPQLSFFFGVWALGDMACSR
jgi:hypothetical protein